MSIRPLALIFAAGCGNCAFPDAPTPVDGVLDESDDCGFWAMGVGEHLVASLPVEGPDTTCAIDADAPLRANSTPIYSDFGEGGPHYTFDFVADAAGTGLIAQIDCDDGSSWAAKVNVE